MDGDTWKNKIVIGITGASGSIYGYRLVKVLAQAGKEIHVILSDPGEQLLSMELGIGRSEIEKIAHRLYTNREMDSPLSSGSHLFNSMVIAPCTMKTLGAIASGISSSLIPRVAEVCLKENRKLILVPRETPLSLVHIRNMEKAALAGATILPAMPAFYHNPKTMESMVDHVVGKILDQLGIDHGLFKRWGEDPDSRDS
jgi:4-hydroxy-3-polyprenylbenzoate decarboxylase